MIAKSRTPQIWGKKKEKKKKKVLVWMRKRPALYGGWDKYW
jgi:hypothetical protein